MAAQKSKLLLVYLLINQGIRIQKDKVLGIFFAELSPESADNIFHQAITNIRNVLKPPATVKQTDDSKAKRVKNPQRPKAPYHILYMKIRYCTCQQVLIIM